MTKTIRANEEMYGAPTRPAPSTSPSASESASPDISLLGVFALLLRNRRLLILLPLVLAVITAAVSVSMRPTYTTVMSFVPQSTKLPNAALTGMAAQFGLSIPGDAGQSPAFYADLLTSRAILAPVVQGTYEIKTSDGNRRGDLVELYKIRGDNPGIRLSRAIQRLQSDLTVFSSTRTNVISVSVRSIDPNLSASIAQRLFDELNNFNLQRRNSQAGAERKFTERRLDEVKQELKRAEDAEAAFLERNREFRNSPQLSFAQEQLAREVTLRQQVYAMLAQSVEQSRIEEVRDTPALTLIEVPNPPSERDPRRTVLKALVALFAGLTLAVLIAFVKEFLAYNSAAHPSRYATFSAQLRMAKGELARPWRLFRQRAH